MYFRLTDAVCQVLATPAHSVTDRQAHCIRLLAAMLDSAPVSQMSETDTMIMLSLSIVLIHLDKHKQVVAMCFL